MLLTSTDGTSPIFGRFETTNSSNNKRQIKTYHRSVGNSVQFEPTTDYVSDNNEWNNIIVIIDNNVGNYKMYHNGISVLDYNFNTDILFMMLVDHGS